ncbi:MAG: tetratricopeptide repeat protein [Magnetococcales bacterium]|nr:tetratricopeptide repeat protein [Magnetococcales bacterium]
MSRALRRRKKNITPRVPPRTPVAPQQHSRVEHGFNLLVQGRLSEAWSLFHDILALDPSHPDAMHGLGIICYHRKQWSEAVTWISQTVALRPAFVDAINNLGLALQETGRLEEAVQCYRQALALNPNLSQCHNNLGNVLGKLGNFDAAMASFRQALALQPDYVEAMNNLGNVLLDQGQWDQAVASYRRAIATQPHLAEAHRNLGNALKQKNRLEEACQCYRDAIDLQPDWAAAHACLGETLQLLGRPEEAEIQWRQVLQREPGQVEAIVKLAEVLCQLRRLETAEALLTEALGTCPDHPDLQVALGGLRMEQNRFAEAHSSFEAVLMQHQDHPQALANLGIVLQELNRLEEGVACLNRALARDPDSAANHCNLGAGLQKLGRFSEAEQHLRRALALRADDPGTLTLLGFVLQETGRLSEALEAYRQALEVDPHFAEAHFCQGLTHLLRGDWRTGWDLYEWRWKRKSCKPHNRPEPLWQGEDPTGSTVLLHCEQGFGDSIQFIRFAPELQRLGGRVVVLCPEPLESLFRSAPGIDFLTSRPDQLPPCSWQVPLLSLPSRLRLNPDHFPRQLPYLSADPGQARIWMEARGPGYHIGLVWRGSPNHKNDRNRSLPLHHLPELLGVDDCVFHLFQRDLRPEESSFFSSQPRCIDERAGMTDFAATAAALAAMDLVIGVDTALIHLAGATGRPTWVLLPFVPDWRWLLQRDDTPWYPTLRLFRQPRPGDWNTVIRRVVEALRLERQETAGVREGTAPSSSEDRGGSQRF